MEDKRLFVEELSKVISKHSLDIERLEYFKPGNYYNEEVVVTYFGGYTKTINVSCDSIRAILRDLVKQEGI